MEIDLKTGDVKSTNRHIIVDSNFLCESSLMA